MELVSCNHCCSGKAISITYCEFMFVALGVQPAMRRCHIAICDLTGSTKHFFFISHTTGFVENTLFKKNYLLLQLWNILGTFAKFRKATISFVMSVRSSAWDISASLGRIFMKFDIWSFFSKIRRENTSSIKIGQE